MYALCPQVKEVEENLEGFCLSTYTNTPLEHHSNRIWLILKYFCDLKGKHGKNLLTKEFITFLKSVLLMKKHNYTHNA